MSDTTEPTRQVRCESLNPIAYDINQTVLQCELALPHEEMHCYSGSSVPVYWPWSGWEAVAAGELLALEEPERP